MKCKYFGKCGSCTLYKLSYQEQLNKKINFVKGLFEEYNAKKIDVFTSKEEAFRNRAELRIWHKGDNISYAMNGFAKKEIVEIDNCKIVQDGIQKLMPRLLNEIKKSKILKERLFGIEFLNGDRVLATLIYHKKIDDIWQEEAKKLQKLFEVDIIGRSRGIKIVLDREFVYKKYVIDTKEYIYKIYENSFLQPNDGVNKNMIEWAKSNSIDFGGDLLELYCGHGNFTIPLSENFDKVLATEISKRSIKAAKENCVLNGVVNIDFVRMSSEELASAINKKRVFRRLRDIDLERYNFSTIIVDPPRAGVDRDSLELMKRFENILYISCNPKTLKRDIELLKDTHKIDKFAVFDQFVYTDHIECGVVLKKI